MNLHDLSKLSETFAPSPKMPVLFTSHGNPMEALSELNATPFFTSIGAVGKSIREEFPIRAILVISAHWLTRGTWVNASPVQETIHDYYGFPPEFYEIQYPAKGSPEIAAEVAQLLPGAKTTTDWGLDHGSWPVLRHYFPNGDIPVFQLSIDYYQPASYHFELAQNLRSLREKGVLIIGSGAVVHNLRAAGPKFFSGDRNPYGWEIEFDQWVKKKLDERDFDSLVNYEKMGSAGTLSVPTPDHYVPMLYSLGVMDKNETITHTFEEILPAFSNRGFRIG
jgi:4,5-DOPA dioxygenase extradiol